MKLNGFIDHTNLRPDATAKDIERLCNEAVEHHFHCVVVNPTYVSPAAKLLKKTEIKVCSVIGFPLGANQTEIKMAEAARAEADGAHELDIVVNIGWMVDKSIYLVVKEISEIHRHLSDTTVTKVIIETPLTPQSVWKETIDALIRTRVDFVKTATGFFGPTPISHVQELKKLCGKKLLIKAAGGIKTADDARAMIDAGASRLGSSSSVQIVTAVEQM